MSIWKGPIPVNNFDGGRLNPVRFVVVHHMAGTAAGADARFHNSTAQVSAHYGVLGSGDVWQWVDESNTAFHAGNYTANSESVGIEHEDNNADDFTDAEYQASGALVAGICSRLGVPVQRGSWPSVSGVIRHGEIVATQCPGALDIYRIIEIAQEVDMALTDADKAFIAAQTEIVVNALVAVERRGMRGADPGAAGNDTPIVADEKIFQTEAK